MKSCTNCEKLLADDVMFCTECGQNLSTIQEKRIFEQNPTSDSTSSKCNTKFNIDFVFKINHYIDRYGTELLNRNLSILAIITGTMIFIFGFLACALITAAINAYLIYRDYRHSQTMNIKICLWSIAALTVWLFICF